MNKVLRKIFIISILFFIGLSTGSVWAKTTIQYWHTWKANTWLPEELKREFEKAYPSMSWSCLQLKDIIKSMIFTL
jgi:CO dehydrogenase/acetyl-CoA synthase beta subunit